MLRRIMSSFIATLQVLLLLSALPLVMLSLRTSRAHRNRHGSYMAAASMMALLAGMGALISLSLALGDDDAIDHLLSFVPPTITLAASAAVLRRGMSDPTRRHRRR